MGEWWWKSSWAGRGALLEAANFGSLAHRLRRSGQMPSHGRFCRWLESWLRIPEGSQRGAEGGMGTHASGSDGEGPQPGRPGAGWCSRLFVARLGSWAFRRNKHGQPWAGDGSASRDGRREGAHTRGEGYGHGLPRRAPAGGKAREEQENALVGNAIDPQYPHLPVPAMTQGRGGRSQGSKGTGGPGASEVEESDGGWKPAGAAGRG